MFSVPISSFLSWPLFRGYLLLPYRLYTRQPKQNHSHTMHSGVGVMHSLPESAFCSFISLHSSGTSLLSQKQKSRITSFWVPRKHWYQNFFWICYAKKIENKILTVFLQIWLKNKSITIKMCTQILSIYSNHWESLYLLSDILSSVMADKWECQSASLKCSLFSSF